MSGRFSPSNPLSLSTWSQRRHTPHLFRCPSHEVCWHIQLQVGLVVVSFHQSAGGAHPVRHHDSLIKNPIMSSTLSLQRRRSPGPLDYFLLKGERVCVRDKITLTVLNGTGSCVKTRLSIASRSRRSCWILQGKHLNKVAASGGRTGINEWESQIWTLSIATFLWCVSILSWTSNRSSCGPPIANSCSIVFAPNFADDALGAGNEKEGDSGENLCHVSGVAWEWHQFAAHLLIRIRIAVHHRIEILEDHFAKSAPSEW